MESHHIRHDKLDRYRTAETAILTARRRYPVLVYADEP